MNSVTPEWYCYATISALALPVGRGASTTSLTPASAARAGADAKLHPCMLQLGFRPRPADAIGCAPKHARSFTSATEMSRAHTATGVLHRANAITHAQRLCTCGHLTGPRLTPRPGTHRLIHLYIDILEDALAAAGAPMGSHTRASLTFWDSKGRGRGLGELAPATPRRRRPAATRKHRTPRRKPPAGSGPAART